jgi:hypothetical protein
VLSAPRGLSFHLLRTRRGCLASRCPSTCLLVLLVGFSSASLWVPLPRLGRTSGSSYSLLPWLPRPVLTVSVPFLLLQQNAWGRINSCYTVWFGKQWQEKHLQMFSSDAIIPLIFLIHGWVHGCESTNWRLNCISFCSFECQSVLPVWLSQFSVLLFLPVLFVSWEISAPLQPKWVEV